MAATKSWLWPDRTIGKRESRTLRDEHNATVNEHAALLAALVDAEFLLRKVGINWKESAAMADSMKRSASDARAAIALATREAA